MPTHAPPTPRAAAIICCLATLAVTAHAQVKDWPREGPPRPLSARAVAFPPYHTRTLPNGLQVVVVAHHEQPVVSLRLLVRAGTASDPAGKPGVAALAGALLDQGTTTRDAAEIADTIETMGGALDAGAASDATFVHALVMNDSVEIGLALLSDVVRHPAFAAGELERQRQQLLSGLMLSAEDPDALASRVLDRLIYGFHPYGLPGSGSVESLASIAPADLRAFHDRYFAPNNALLAIVGDVAAAEAFDAATRVFGPWTRRDVPPPPDVEPPQPTRRIVVIDKPDAVQTEIRVGQLTLPRRHADHVAIDLAIKVLGGEGSNRLHRVLRSERGLTYDAQAVLHPRAHAGDFAAETATRTDTTGEVLRLVVDEIATLVRERVSERELAGAKAALTGSFPLRIETPDAIAAQVLDVLFYDLPAAELGTYRERVASVTVEELQRVTRAYLKPERLSVVLVGNAKGFAGQLPGFGFDDYEVVGVRDLDITTADLRRASSDAAEGQGHQPTRR
jgi:zinc protease